MQSLSWFLAILFTYKWVLIRKFVTPIATPLVFYFLLLSGKQI